MVEKNQETPRRRRIIYVEDNLANIGLVERAARAIDAEASFYDTGEDALLGIMEEEPDIVLMDVQLRGELDGLEVVRRLRAAGYQKPIIAVTAYAMKGDRERCLEAGCDDYMPKPLPVPQLFETFKRYLNVNLRTVEFDGTDTTFSKKQPSDIFPELVNKPPFEWAKTISETLEATDSENHGRAVIALAVFQKETNAPFNITEGQKFFWSHVRHSLPSATMEEAETQWGKLARVALALIQPVDQISKALQDCLSHENWKVRQWALTIMLQDKVPEVVQLAANALNDDSGEVRSSAGKVLVVSQNRF